MNAFRWHLFQFWILDSSACRGGFSESVKKRLPGSDRKTRPRLSSKGASCCAIAFSLIFGATFSSTNPVQAQILPDNTLGGENSIVTPINPQLEQIDGGAIRGANLFHSFLEFSINEGNAAYFANPAGITNIFSRVTGSNPSYLFGTLGVLGEANLFFLNPNGIVFGPKASLDLRGSFVATTAHSIIFPDGEQFSAVNPNGAPLLTIDVPVPVSVQFESERSGSIVNAGNLAVDAGQNLSLLGGTVVNTGQLVAPAGEISLLAVPEGMSAVALGMGGEVLGFSAVVGSPVADAPELEELVEGAGMDLGLGVQIPDKGGVAIASGRIDVSGDNGGIVRILGDRVGLIAADLNASGTNGGGTVLIGGDYQGKDSILNASRTFVSNDSVITADALSSGDGGRGIVWADGTTGFYGTISATGGSERGDGGFVEVSGKENLAFRGEVDTSAVNGEFGTLLLDPRNILIANSNNPPGVVGALPDIFASDFAGQDITIDAATLQNQRGRVILEATNDITIAPGVSLDFLAGSVNLFPPRIIPGGSITFTADADRDGIGSFLNFGGLIDTDGRDLIISGASVKAGDIDASWSWPSVVIPPPNPLSRNIPLFAGNITITAANGIETGTLNTVGLAGISVAGISFDPGSIALTSNEGGITTGRLTSSAIGGDGDSGTIQLKANGNITTREDIISFNAGDGNGGAISLISDRGEINTRAASINSGAIDGDGGAISLRASNNIATNTIISASQNDTGGAIEIASQDGSINTTAGTLIAGSQTNQGNSGDVTLRANGNLSTASILAGSSQANGGQIVLTSQNGAINTTTGLIDSGSTVGTGGDITVNANSDIAIAGIINSAGQQQSGDITIESNNGAIDTTAGILNSGSSNFGNPPVEGQQGNIRLDAAGTVAVGTINSSSKIGDGGDISLTSRGGGIDATPSLINSGSTVGTGGDITVNANSDIAIAGFVNSAGQLGSGDITINSNNGGIVATESVINGGGKPTDTKFFPQLTPVLSLLPNINGDGGDVAISARNNIILDQTGINLSGGDRGAGGLGTFVTDADFSLTDSLIGSQSNQGAGDRFDIQANSLSLTRSAIGSRALNDSSLGNIRIQTSDFVELKENSSLGTNNRSSQPSGDITINTGRLTLLDGSFVTASTASAFPEGRGGTLNVQANFVEIIGTRPDNSLPSGLFSISRGSADAGDLIINTDRLVLRDGGVVSASAYDIEGSLPGKGGDILVDANSVLVSGTSANQLFSSAISVDSIGDAPAGNLFLNADRLTVENGAALSASSSQVKGKSGSNTQGGNINVNAANITLRGTSQDGKLFSGIYAQSFSEGNGGDLTINATEDIRIENGARVTVSSNPLAEDAGNLREKTQTLLDLFRGLGIVNTNQEIIIGFGLGDAGNINIAARNIFLSNQGQITAETSSGEGGNINLNAKHLVLMRNNSLISTTAGTAQAGGNGGNINISALFVLAVPRENSDIAANAFTGNGGRVTINATGIFGLTFRPLRTPFSDITASSTFGAPGVVELNTLNIDPSRGLQGLPADPVDAEIAEGCAAIGRGESVEFVNIGRGGMPPSPDDWLSSDAITADWIDFPELSAIAPSQNISFAHPILQFGCRDRVSFSLHRQAR